MNENGQRNVSETFVQGPTEIENLTQETIKTSTQPSSSQLRKARRKKDNRKLKKKLNKKMTEHTDKLQQHG